jgi:ComF family protein
VRALKFRGLDYLGAHLGAELVSVVGELGGGWDVVVPVPLHWRRRWRRGYNQADRIARSLAARLGVPCRAALRRRRATRPQVGLPRTERLLNPRGAFAPRRRSVFGAGPAADRSLAGRRVLLVDDVVTSGGTMGAAAEALLAAGAERVAGVAVARTPSTA